MVKISGVGHVVIINIGIGPKFHNQCIPLCRVPLLAENIPANGKSHLRSINLGIYRTEELFLCRATNNRLDHEAGKFVRTKTTGGCQKCANVIGSSSVELFSDRNSVTLLYLSVLNSVMTAFTWTFLYFRYDQLFFKAFQFPSYPQLS